MLEAARLYAITPDAEPDAVVGLVGAVLRGGADVVQLRHKTLARGALLDLAGRLAALVHGAGRLFIVNDHLDIALIAGADGVHLGAHDLPLDRSRQQGEQAREDGDRARPHVSQAGGAHETAALLAPPR